MAHDPNNLLTPILGYGDILAQDLDDENAPLAQEIVEAATRARDLVHQLLAFSRNQVMAMAPVDLNEVVARFTNLLRRAIREDIEIVVIPATGLPPIMGDVGQLEQVINERGGQCARRHARGRHADIAHCRRDMGRA